MSLIFPDHNPATFDPGYSAGSGLVWLDELFNTEAEASAVYPNVDWSYMYSGQTSWGELSDWSMIFISGRMQWFWDSYSGMYAPQCRWEDFSINAVSGGVFRWIQTTTFNEHQYNEENTLRIVYSGSYIHTLAPSQTYNTNGVEERFYVYDVDDYSVSAYSGVSSFTYNGSIAGFVVCSGTWIVQDNEEDIIVNNVLNNTIACVSGFDTSYLTVVETRHTYSGEPEDAWRDWTQDEAALQECYERTIGGATVGTDEGFYSFYSNPSGVSTGAYGLPPKYTIPPGHYYVSFGHMWWHTNCHIDALGARFEPRKKWTQQNVGKSATWRSPADEAKAVLTIGRDLYLRSPNLGVYDTYQAFECSEIKMPAITARASADGYFGHNSGDFGDYQGALLRILGVYQSKIHNINLIGPAKYGIIWSQDGVGHSYNDYEFFQMYNFAIFLKWRNRQGNNTGVGWFNNTTLRNGWFIQASGTPAAPTSQYPTICFDNDNSLDNPWRDQREDIMHWQNLNAEFADEQFYTVPSFWTDNMGLEMANIKHFIRASGMTNWHFMKGRFEGQEAPFYDTDKNQTLTTREWWLRPPIGNNTFRFNNSHSALTGIPKEYIGNGIDFVQSSEPLPGFSQRGRFSPYKLKIGSNSNTGPGNNRAQLSISQDLNMTGPGGQIHVLSENKQKHRAIYVDEVIDPVSSKSYPVVKVRDQPYAWIKWKLDIEPDSAYSDDIRSFPVGSTISYKVGDFASLPNSSHYVRPYLYWWPVGGSYGPTAYSGLVDGVVYTSLYASNANVVNNEYAIIRYTYETSGIISPSCWVYDVVSGRRIDQTEHGYLITISGQ